MDGRMQRWLGGEQEVAAERGGGVQEVEINLQATPTVHSLWGVEMCMCFTAIGRVNGVSIQFDLFCNLPLDFDN